MITFAVRRNYFVELISEISEKTGLKWNSVMHAFIGNNIEQINSLKRALERLQIKQKLEHEAEKAKMDASKDRSRSKIRSQSAPKKAVEIKSTIKSAEKRKMSAKP